jgi:hypothetical protein
VSSRVESLLWKSVKAALSADVTREHPRFRRVRHGVYQINREGRRTLRQLNPSCHQKPG